MKDWLRVLIYGREGYEDLGLVSLTDVATDLLVRDDPGFIVKHAGPMHERAVNMIREQRIEQLRRNA